MITHAFIDGANLFYAQKIGWWIDYEKLIRYLEYKYETSLTRYFAGIDTNNNTPRKPLHSFREFKGYISTLGREKKSIAFYEKLESFGYELILKPIKRYSQNGTIHIKANCDIDIALYMIKEKDTIDRIILLSGDGDFFPVLEYLISEGKQIIVIAWGSNTAREIKNLMKGNFTDMENIRPYIMRERTK
jgi:uncharacterized LabA/DUF88 family protein